MRGVKGSEPDGYAGDAFWILAIHEPDAGLTVAELYHWIKLENEGLGLPALSPAQVYAGLDGLARRRPPLAAPDRPGRGHVNRWRITGHGRDMLNVWCPDDEPDEPARVPCGLGWPP